MKKRFIAGFLAGLMLVSLASCGLKGKTPVDSASSESIATSSSVSDESKESPDSAEEEGRKKREEALEQIRKSYGDSLISLKEETEKQKELIDDSFDQYLAQVEAVQKLYALYVSEPVRLYQEVEEKSIAYYKLVAEVCDTNVYESWNPVLVEYDQLRNEWMDSYYDGVAALLEQIGEYYEAVIQKTDLEESMKDENLTVVYVEKDQNTQQIYTDWVAAMEQSNLEYSAILGGFFEGSPDIDEIIRKALEERDARLSADGQATSTDPDLSPDQQMEDENTVVPSDVSPEFKGKMDGYLAFFREYADFMMDYREDRASDEIREAAVSINQEYDQMMPEVYGIETDSLSEADAAYYRLILDKIQKALASIPG